MDSFPSGSEVLAFLISPDAKMEDCSFLHSSTNFSVFILTCQIICMTVLHLFVTIFVLTFLFPCFDFTACNLHSRISGRLGLEVIRHLMKYDCSADNIHWIESSSINLHAVPSLPNTGGRSPACLGCSSPVPPGFPSVLLKKLCHYTLHRDIHFHEYQGILCSLLSWHSIGLRKSLDCFIDHIITLLRIYGMQKSINMCGFFLFNSLGQIPEP